MCRIKSSSSQELVLDCASCPYEFGSPVCISDLFHTLSLNQETPDAIRFEEEIVFNLPPEKTKVLTQYTELIKKVRKALLDPELFGPTYDDNRERRKEVLKRIYYELFRSPLNAHRLMSEYEESGHTRKIYLEAYRRFRAFLDSLSSQLGQTALYKLFKEKQDFRNAFFSLIGIKALPYIDLFVLELPPGVKKTGTSYTLDFGFHVDIYEYKERESYLYVIDNPVLANLEPSLSSILKRKIIDALKEVYKPSPGLFDKKYREFAQWFLNEAVDRGLNISTQEALVLGREVAVWSVGMGGPVENISMDVENVTDIYIDSENSPVYVEHRDFGITHTLMRYNRELLERAFTNAVLLSAEDIKFDERHPVFDAVIERLHARVHLQRPPATFGELQAAIRLMKPTPFTYPEYLKYRSMSAFMAAYDDLMVSLGSSEAVLGLKGVGKTSFTAAKIASIGTKRRIIPIQDIEEIPIKIFRKLGFHIGAARVRASISEEQYGEKALDLVAMANALLRMGDAALIINEIRSRSAIQGVINLLNTQPGVFLLYNLHAESLDDVRSRLELVFGIPSASMYATDRYSILKKVRFGRKGKVHRLLGEVYETARKEKQFVKVFEFQRGPDFESSHYVPAFIKNPEAQQPIIRKLDWQKLSNELDLAFVPPVLKEKSADIGISPEQLILQVFFKAKVFSDIYELAVRLGRKDLFGLEFFLLINANVNKLLARMEQAGSIDYNLAWKEWTTMFKTLVKDYLRHQNKAGHQ